MTERVATATLPSEDWQALALCPEVGFDFFKVGKGGSYAAAALICRACEVRDPCLEQDLTEIAEHEMEDSEVIMSTFRGGLTPPQIQSVYRLRKKGTSAAVVTRLITSYRTVNVDRAQHRLGTPEGVGLLAPVAEDSVD